MPHEPRRYAFQNADIVKALVARYGLRGDVGLDLVGEAVPVVVLDDITAAPEQRACSGFGTVAAGVGPDLAAIRLDNPVNSNIVVVCTDVWCRTTVATQVAVQWPTGTGVVLPATAATTLGFRDALTPGTPVAQIVQDISNLVTANEKFRFLCTASTVTADQYLPAFGPVALHAGQGLQLRALATPATAGFTAANFHWLEIPAQQFPGIAFAG